MKIDIIKLLDELSKFYVIESVKSKRDYNFLKADGIDIGMAKIIKFIEEYKEEC